MIKVKSRNILTKILKFNDSLFDRLYSPPYNPLYYTGTITIALFSLMILSGVYLFLFYDVASPYESIINIQNQAFFGKFIRALHRYATDLALIFVIAHLLRMFVEGKNFGARTISWLSGLVLLGFLFVSAFTGYILVWDEHGLLLARFGGKLLDLIPIFHEPPSRTFSGEGRIDTSFFFINLFMHVALPSFMSLVLWIHTLRIDKVKWFPKKHFLYSVIGILFLVSILYPLKTMPKANVLEVPEFIAFDWIYNFWLLFSLSISSYIIWFIIIILALVAVTVPWWWKPKEFKVRKIATSNENFCSSCTRCTIDCPYNAISMVDIGKSGVTRFMAIVDSKLCVSCGICAASCDLVHLGPPDLQAFLQVQSAKTFISSNKINKKRSIVVISCSSLGNTTKDLELAFKSSSGFNFSFYNNRCIGSLHMFTLETLLKSCAGIIVVSCPLKACQAYIGPDIFKSRLNGSIEPSISQDLQKKVLFINFGLSDRILLLKKKNAFLDFLKDEKKLDLIFFKSLRLFPIFKALLISTVFCFFIAYSSSILFSYPQKDANLRVSWRFVSQKIERCKVLSSIEMQKIPKHMRNPRGVCSSTSFDYNLSVKLDGKEIINKKYYRKGLKADGAIFILVDLPVKPGIKDVFVTFSPVIDKEQNIMKEYKLLLGLIFNKKVQFCTRKTRLISLDFINNKLIII